MEIIELKPNEVLHIPAGQTLGATDGGEMEVRFDSEGIVTGIATLTLETGREPLYVSAHIGGNVISYTLDWGDGSVVSGGKNVSHYYEQSGTYAITFTTGGVTVTVLITVYDAALFPETKDVTLYDVGAFG